jgi:hypothetical protein
LLLFLLFSLFPCFLSLVIAHILRGASHQSMGFLLSSASAVCHSG